MARIFLSHASGDNRQAIALRQWLVQQQPRLSTEIFLDIDPENGIRPGVRWKEAVRQANTDCEVVICLISRRWHESHECKAEYRLAEALGKPILVARLEPAGDDITGEWQRCDLFGEGPATRIYPGGTGDAVEFRTAGLDHLLTGLDPMLAARAASLSATGTGRFGFHPPGRARVWLALGAVLVLATSVGIYTWARGTDNSGDSTTPLTVDVATVVTGRCTTLIFDKPIAELGSPPKLPAEYAKWAWQHNGVEAAPFGGFRAGRVQLSMRGTGPTPVTITSLSAEVVDRKPGPMTGTVVSGQCGSSTTGRLAEVDLDADPPKILRSNSDPNQLWGQDTNTTPLQFPYKITDTDSELLLIIAEVRSNDTVSYRLHIGWTDGARSGTEVVDNGGKPFQVATADTQALLYVPSGDTFTAIK